MYYSNIDDIEVTFKQIYKCSPPCECMKRDFPSPIKSGKIEKVIDRYSCARKNMVSQEYSDHYPRNVGILAMEAYFPSLYVAQAELEKFDGVSAGKYTVGLGQTKMSFCGILQNIIKSGYFCLKKLVGSYFHL